MNDLDTPTLERCAKRFRTVQASAALHGWRLLRAHPDDADCLFALRSDNTVLVLADTDHAMQRLCGGAQWLPSIEP
jgi:hypothetical protein